MDGRMDLKAALRVLSDRRDREQVVVTSMSATREWPSVAEPHPLDFHFLPSTMSGAVPIGLGLALAQPRRQVTVLSGDGSLLMSLGCLVSVIDAGATNLDIVLIDNSRYEITGGQKTAASANTVDFAGVARSVGFRNVARFADVQAWNDGADDLFSRPGPRFVWLEVTPEPTDYAVTSPCPMAEQIERLRGEFRFADG